jgi:phage FluMu gp28-like protein
LAASSGIRGGRKDVIFDEFSHIEKSRELFYAAAPAIINGGHTMDIVSTPAGDQDLCSEIWFNRPDPRTGTTAYGDFSRHQFIWCDVRRFVNDYDAVQHVWYKELNQDMTHMEQLVRDYGTEKLKFYYNIYPWSMFLQEFCGSFIDEANQLFPQELIRRAMRGTVAEADDLEEEAIQVMVERPKGNDDEIYIGIDFGESSEDTDKTSIQVVIRQDGIFKQVYKENFSKGEDFPKQSNRIVKICRNFRPNKIYMDGTGLGRGIVPMIKERSPELNIEAITFDYINKEEMAMNIKKLMEEDKLWIQADDLALHAQFRGMERKLTEAGRATYHGKPHDDMFWALCLAVKKGAYNKFNISFLGGAASYRSPI